MPIAGEPWRRHEDRGGVIRSELTDQLAAVLRSTVTGGPFAGMKLVTDTSWGDGTLIPKLLGCYEEELHPAFGLALGRQPECVVNIGCAEGYYAVGLARLLFAATVIAFDTDENAQKICRAAAGSNGVAARLRVEGECAPARLGSITATGGRKLLVIDCEGAELALLSDTVIRGMKDTDVIVECHDFIDPSITETLIERFAASHTVERVEQGGRNPNAYPPLRQLDELYRWLVISEQRPVSMNWLACWSR